MTETWTQRLVGRLAGRTAGPTRRGFIGSAALVGAAVAVNPWGFLVRPASAYDTVCGTHTQCSDGYTVFCCTINGGTNTCPPNTFIGGWWKADNSSFCGGNARYYIDCNALKDDPNWPCSCGDSSTCDQRRIACNQFRYGQCRLDIPMSASGPVVCRMVSCTPPWQQFAGICTTTSATDNRTASHSAPCIDGSPPRGSLDQLIDVGGAVRVRGWAYDPDQPEVEIPVALYRNDIGVAWFPTGVARPDVGAAFGIAGHHGFDITLPSPAGTHEFAVFGINVGPARGNPVVGSGSVVVSRVPVGILDSAVPGPGGTIRVRGWAFDPDQSGTAIQVAVYRDDVGVSWFPTGIQRPDVNSAFGISGQHGFDISVPSPPGDHHISVFAIDLGPAGNPLIGRRGVVGIGLPIGWLDSLGVVAGLGRTVRIRGWAYDPDQPATAIEVEVFVDGASSGRTVTSVMRDDVNTAFGLTGRHGFSIDISPAAGTRRISVVAVNIGAAAADQHIGTREVAVP